MFKRGTIKRPSISRWAKDHRDALRTVQFQHPHTPDPHWRKKHQYARWRAAVLKRDHFRCVRCGTKLALQAHHKIPAAVCPALKYEVWNGETLCPHCHAQVPHQMDPVFWEKMINDD